MLNRLRARFINTSSLTFQAPDPPNQTPPAPPPAPPAPPQPQPAPQPAPPAPPAGETSEQRVSRLERALADTRAEAAAYRIDSRTAKETSAALEAQLAEARTASDARAQEIQRNADTHVQSERQLRIDAELKAAAVSAGLVDPDLLPLIDKRAVKVDANGVVTGLSEAIAAFKTSKPAYFRDVQQQPAPAPRATTTGIQTPPPAPGAAPPVTTVADIPKGKEGRPAYEAAKRAGLAALRQAGG